MFQQYVKSSIRILLSSLLMIAFTAQPIGNVSALHSNSTLNAQLNYAIVFVSRKIPRNGTIYMAPNETGSLPGVGPFSRFEIAAPGKLIVREANGILRMLIDGANPGAASLNIIDVNAPDVSYDGKQIVFAGITKGSYDLGPMNDPGNWRIYTINVDGTGLRQVTFSDQDNLDLSQFGGIASHFKKYDDTDPAWLPDGRIVFSSTRWPSHGMYGGARTSNLYVVSVNGTGLHRITSERNSADRPQIDPLTGKIVYARWWRNFRVATNNMGTIADPNGGYVLKDGLVVASKGGDLGEVGGYKNLERNAWHLATVNPDGTGLAQWAGASNTTYGGQNINQAYGGSFSPDGSFYANFFPMANQTEAAGFGGIRHYQRGPQGYTPVIGITTRDETILKFVKTNPNSYGVYQGNYAAEPEVLPDGRLIISWAKDIAQDYGLYTINADGSGLTLLYDNPGTTELRTRVIRTRTTPPILPDSVTTTASLLPPLAAGPYNKDGTFTFKALNVYFNAPVDTNIMSAIPVGSANTIRFFIDHQRSQQSGSYENLDWPILLNELSVNPDGSVTTTAPANVPLFEQIRTQSPGYTVPLTGRTTPPEQKTGAAHVAGMNFGHPGEVVTCVGCHAGHSMIPIPANPADARWTNLAPGAAISVSSLNSSLTNADGLIDRRVKMQVPNTLSKYWLSKSGLTAVSQWVQLTFPVPVIVRTVRLYNIPAVDSSIKVLKTTVRLYTDVAGTQQAASTVSGALSENGTDVTFHDTLTRVVRIEFNSVSGAIAGLGEVEVIARSGSAEPTANWHGGISITSDQKIVAVGRLHIGNQVTTYDGFAAGATSMYVPMLFRTAFGGNYNSALYIQNVDANAAANVTIKYYDSNGTLTCTVDDSIAALASHGYWIPSVACLPDGWVGGAVITGDHNVVAVGRLHIGNQVTTYDGFAAGSLTTYAPMLYKTTDNGTRNSALYIQNVDDSNVANITINYYDSTGTLTCTINDNIPAFSSHGYWIPSVGCLPNNWEGQAVISADHNIVAIARPHFGNEIFTYNGFTDGSLSNSVPMLFSNAFGGGYNSGLHLENLHTSTTAHVTLKFYDTNGNLSCTKTESIPPLSASDYWLPGIVCLP